MTNDNGELEAVVAVIFIAAVMIVGMVYIAGGIMSVTVVDNKVITIQEKLGAHGADGQYLVIDTDGNVYTVEDNFLLGSFDASNRYAKMKDGGTYDVELRGIRFPFMSWYKNILTVHEFMPPLKAACPEDSTAYLNMSYIQSECFNYTMKNFSYTVTTYNQTNTTDWNNITVDLPTPKVVPL